jgi:hypothetical protein
VDTSLWLPTTSDTVLESLSPVGEYKYVLMNKDDGEKTLAKYFGTEQFFRSLQRFCGMQKHFLASLQWN